jgi:hypothetical protein
VAADELGDWTKLMDVKLPSGAVSWKAIAGCVRSVSVWPFYCSIVAFLGAGALAA